MRTSANEDFGILAENDPSTEVPGSHEGLSLPADLMGSSASNDLRSFGSFNDWEGESLLASNSPVGIGEQATGLVDVPGEKQNEAAAAAAAIWPTTDWKK